MSNDLNQRLAQVEKLLAEIKEALAAKPSDDKSLPSQVEDANYAITLDGRPLPIYERHKQGVIDAGVAYRTREQAEAWAHVRSVLGRIRQMPGQVDPSKDRYERICVRAVKKEIKILTRSAGWDSDSGFMFPAFATKADAKHAIDTIGPDNLIRCAATMAGVRLTMKAELTEDGYTPDRKMRLVPVDMTPEQWVVSTVGHALWTGCIESAPNPLAHYFDKPEAPTTDADGWIPWGGGECPIAKAARRSFELRFRDGDESISLLSPSEWEWSHDGGENDIIAYRIIGDDK